jgi:hypothetical protein
MADKLNKLVFKLRKLTAGATAGYFQILSCTAILPPSVRFFEFDNFAYTLDDIKELGAQTIAENPERMKGFDILIEYE